MRTYRYMADISSNNGRVNIDTYSKDGHCLIGIKATEGSEYVNPLHAEQARTAHANGLTVIHYHFCRPGQNSLFVEQKRFVDESLKYWQKGDRLAYDLEVNEKGLAPITYIDHLLNDTHRQTNLDPILYTYLAYAGEHLKGLRFPGNSLWVADYSDGKPIVPRGINLWAWQYTDGSKGPAPHDMAGIGNCDGSIVNGFAAARARIRKSRRK